MRKKYTLEYKEEAANLVIKQGYSQAEAGRVLGISDTNINRWVVERTEKKSLSSATNSDQEEIKRLKKEIERLRMEREILKKAAAFFANEKL